MSRNAGVSTRVEVVQPSFSVVLNRNRSLQPDLLLYGTNNTLFVDIAVTHPLRAVAHQEVRVARRRRPPSAQHRAHRTIEGDEIQGARNSAQRHVHAVRVRYVRRDGCKGDELITWIMREAMWRPLRRRCRVQSPPPRRTRASVRRHPAGRRNRRGVRGASHPFSSRRAAGRRM